MRKVIRINIPTHKRKVIVLASNIIAKHLADGANSPLSLLNMAEMQNKTDVAKTQNTLAESKSKEAELATEDCEIGRESGRERV